MLDRYNDWSGVMPPDPSAATPTPEAAGPPTQATASAWSPPAQVRHPPFGDGVVESVIGTGDGAKVRVRFGSETKLVLARFLIPASD